MKIGKLPESHLRRSVLRKLNKPGHWTLVGPGIGMDSARLDTRNLVTAQAVVEFPVQNPAKLAVIKAVNNLLTGGGRLLGVMLTILVPAQANETQVRTLVEQAQSELMHYEDKAYDAVCRSAEILGGDVRISPSVHCPVVMVTAYGEPLHTDGQLELAEITPDMDIVMTKWIAMEATYLLAENCYDTLHERLPDSYIRAGLEFGEHLSIAPEIRVMNDLGIYARHDGSYGGIFGCLWELLEPSGLGCQVELPRIPVKQESIEYAEQFHENPYMMSAGGSVLAVSADGRALVHALREQDIYARVIGHTTADKARAIRIPLPSEQEDEAHIDTRRRHESETRYLVPVQSDALFEILHRAARTI